MNTTTTNPSDVIRGMSAIAKYLGVSVTSVYNWHRQDPTFRKAVSRKKLPGRSKHIWLGNRRALDLWAAKA